MRALLPAALAVLLGAAAARADPVDGQAAAAGDAVRAQTSDQKALQAAAVSRARAAVPLRVGRSGPAPFAKGVMTNSAGWLKQTPAIVQFINENGCAVQDGKYAEVRMTCPAAASAGAPACVDFSKVVDEVAKNTELVYIDKDAMKAITGDPRAMAFGVTKELKMNLRDRADPDRPIALGSPGKNTIALRGDPVDPGQKAPEDGIFALVLAHEFLHITLRQFGNPALGGGARLGDGDLAIANLHHRLTDALGWKAVSWGQSDAPWRQGPDKGCAQAGQAAAP